MRPPNSQVSIVVPTYNEREHIAALIESLYAEIESQLEVIVVDDASGDATREEVTARLSGELRGWMEREGDPLLSEWPI